MRVVLFVFCRFFGLFYLDSHAICRLGQFWLFVVFKQFIPFLLSCQSYKSIVFLYLPFSSCRICSGIPCSSLNIGNSFFSSLFLVSLAKDLSTLLILSKFQLFLFINFLFSSSVSNLLIYALIFFLLNVLGFLFLLLFLVSCCRNLDY